MREIITQIANRWARVFVFDSTIEYSRNRDLVDPEERKIYDLVYLSKVTLILDHPAPAPLPPGLAAPATEPCSSISANSNLQGSGSTTGMMEPARPQDSGVSMAELENSGTSTNSVSKMPATFLGSVIAPPDPASDIPVVLCVTFFGGPLAGDVYYHHILPPPPAWLPRPQLFKLGPTLLSANGRQTREDWLDMNIATVLFVGSRTLMAFYGINDEAGFGPEGWKGFKTEFDGELIDPNTTLRKLIKVFLETKPITGTPLVITPILPDDGPIFGSDFLAPLKSGLDKQRSITL